MVGCCIGILFHNIGLSQILKYHKKNHQSNKQRKQKRTGVYLQNLTKMLLLVFKVQKYLSYVNYSTQNIDIDLDETISNTTSLSSEPILTPASRSSSPPPARSQKRKRAENAEDGDKALIQSLNRIQESARERRQQKEDLDINFGLEAAGRLKRLTPRQNALAKLQIQQVLFDTEFKGPGNDEVNPSPYHTNAYEF